MASGQELNLFLAHLLEFSYLHRFELSIGLLTTLVLIALALLLGDSNER